MSHVIPGTVYHVRFLSPFKDGAIFGPVHYKLNEEAKIPAEKYQQAQRSGADMEVIETLYPNPFKKPEPDPVDPAPEPAVEGSDPVTLDLVEPFPVSDEMEVKIELPRRKKARKNGKT